MKRLPLALSGVFLAFSPVHSAILLNEIHLNPPSGENLGDRDYEFIELRSTTDGVESASGLTLLIVNNDRWDYTTDDKGAQVATNLNMGEVTEVWNLDELKTGANGLLLLGNKYGELPKGGPWAGFIDPATEVGDPAGMGDGDIESNNGLSIFLVSGYTNPAANSGAVVDFDVDENGVLDWLQNPVPAGGLSAAPWTAIVDQIGTRDRNITPWPFPNAPADVQQIAEPYTGLANGSAANVNYIYTNVNPNWSIGNKDPESFARKATDSTASSAAEWYGGAYFDAVQGTDPVNTLPYRSNRVFGIANGAATPGRPNLSGDPGVADFRINEVNLDPSEDRFQYIEIVNTNSPPGSRSLNGVWLVAVDSNISTNDLLPEVTNKVGRVQKEWDLSGMATGTNGLLLIADGIGPTFTPFQDYVPLETGKGDPSRRLLPPAASSMGLGDIGSKSGLSFFLIRNYKSGYDINLAEDRDLDTNDDGVLDAMVTNPNNPAAPFASAGNLANVTVLDSVGFDMAGVGPEGTGKTYASVNLRTVFPEFVPTDGNKASDNFSRKVADGAPVTANNVNSWYGGEFPGSGGFNLGYQLPALDEIGPNNPDGVTHFGGFRGAATPGRPNLSGPVNPASPPVAGELRISEVMFDATDTQVGADPDDHDLDLNRDYVELLSTSRSLAYFDGYWIVIVDNAGSNKGVIRTGAPLDGNTTGPNGLMLIGDNYDTTISIPYIGIEGLLPPDTATVDPVVAFGGDDLPGKGATVLLIRGAPFDPASAPNGPFKVGGPIAVTNLRPAGDIDPDNDGVLLPSSEWLTPGAVLVDAVSMGSVNPGPEYGYISGGGWLPDCACRYSGDNRASTAAAWYFGEVDQTANPSVPSTAFTGNFAGTFHGNASPGRWNHVAPVGPEELGAVVINEVHFNPAGGDGNFEFIELLDRSGVSRSLNHYTLLMIDNSGNNTGTIERAWSLDGAMTGPNGLCVLTNGTAVSSPWASFFRPQTAVFDPPGRDDLITGFGEGTLARESGNQSVTLLLVRNFYSAVGADLDMFATGNQLEEIGGDGEFENPGSAWEAGIVHDSVVLRNWLPAEVSPTSVPARWDGFTYSLADLSGQFFPNPNLLFYHPETVARFRGNPDPNSAAWYGGDLTGGATGKLGTDTAYVRNDGTHPPLPANFLGRTTPGQLNLAANESGDPDGDGVITLLEEAFGSDPFSRDSVSVLPSVGTVTDGGQKFAAITFRRIKGGSTAGNVYSAEAFFYTVESSMDMQTWSGDSAAFVPVPPITSNPDGFTETVTLRLSTPVNEPAGKRFMRVRINRR